jgi:hypothetical protein
MKIWTTNYRPFILGGDVNAPIMADVPVSGPFDIGQGFQAYLAVGPNGKTFVAESITGAIVGSTIEQVREDVASGKKSDMDKQIEDAKKMVLRAYEATPEELWKRLKAG